MNKLIFIFALFPFVIFAQDWHEEERTYEYDNLNRLVRVVFHNGIVYKYQYDNLGNRLGKLIDVDLDQDDFEVTSSNIYGCTLGIISVEFEKRNNYHLTLTNNETDEVIEYNTTDYSFNVENLQQGIYTLCISINGIPMEVFNQCFNTIEIEDHTDVSHINEEDFTAFVYGIHSTEGGVTLGVFDEVECHDFNLKVINELGYVLYNNILQSGDYIENTEKGVLTFCITIENIPDEQFKYCFTVGMFRDEADLFDVVAYGDCGIGIVSYRLSNDGYEYLMEIEDENHDYTFYQISGSGADGTGIHDYTVEPNTQYWACLSMDGVDYSSHFCKSVYTSEPHPLRVYYDVDYINQRLFLSISGAILPYRVYRNGVEHIFNDYQTRYIDLEFGNNIIDIWPHNACNGNYTFSVFISDEYLIFPNPTRDILRVVVPIDRIRDNNRVDIIDAQGKVILSRYFNFKSEIEIDVNHLSNATYFINIYNDSNAYLWQSKFIKE